MSDYTQAAQNRIDDLPRLMLYAEQPINLTSLKNLMKKSKHYILRIIDENPDNFIDHGTVIGSQGKLYQSTVKVNKVIVGASTVYNLHDDERYHENMALYRKDRKREKTEIKGNILSCNF